jgi:hypothetical protein
MTVTAQPYNAVTVCKTDNTNAFQAAFNATALTGQDV